MPNTKFRPPPRRKRSFREPDDLRLFIPSLSDGNVLPARHSFAGGNFSPALRWSNLPDDTCSVAVTCEDASGPQGRPFTLWILYNIPTGLPGIPEAISKVPLPPELPGAEQGINDLGSTGYDGPAPPQGHLAHRYEFKVYALDCVCNVPPGVTRAGFESAIEGHVLARGEIVGTYSAGEKP